MAIIFNRAKSPPEEQELPKEPAPLLQNSPSQIFSNRQFKVYEALEETLTMDAFQYALITDVLPKIPGYDPGDFQPWETEHWESLMNELLNSSIQWITRNVEK